MADPDDDTTNPVVRPGGETGDDDTTNPLTRSGGDAGDGAGDLDDATVRIARVEPDGDDDATAVIQRATHDEESTKPMAREHPDETRPMPRVRTRRSMTAPTSRRRGQLHPAPVPEAYGPTAVRASGAGAVTSYRPRAIPAPPPPVAKVETPRLHRLEESGVSVERRSRRFAGIALGAFVLSIVVAAAGIALVVRALVTG